MESKDIINNSIRKINELIEKHTRLITEAEKLPAEDWRMSKIDQSKKSVAALKETKKKLEEKDPELFEKELQKYWIANVARTIQKQYEKSFTYDDAKNTMNSILKDCINCYASQDVIDPVDSIRKLWKELDTVVNSLPQLKHGDFVEDEDACKIFLKVRKEILDILNKVNVRELKELV